jgi:hypothetical protein
MDILLLFLVSVFNSVFFGDWGLFGLLSWIIEDFLGLFDGFY